MAADRSIFPFLCWHSLRMPCPQIIRPWRRACLHRSLLLLIWCMASQTKRTSSSSALKYVQSTVIHTGALSLKLHAFCFCKAIPDFIYQCGTIPYSFQNNENENLYFLLPYYSTDSAQVPLSNQVWKIHLIFDHSQSKVSRSPMKLTILKLWHILERFTTCKVKCTWIGH